MPTFKSLPVEIRNDIYRLLLCPNDGIGRRGRHIVPVPLVKGEIKYNPHPHKPIHPAVLGVSRQIHDESASVLYGVNCFSFISSLEVHLLCQWFEKVGTENLQRIRRATIVLVPYEQSRLTHQQTHDINRIFSKCLKIFTARCSKLQQLAIVENWPSAKVQMAASQHVLALTKVVGLRELKLKRWVSLEAADQMIRLLGLRGQSEIKFEMKMTNVNGREAVIHNKPVWDMVVTANANVDEVVMERLARAWDIFDGVLDLGLDF